MYRENLLDVERTIKVWNIIKVAGLLFSLKKTFTVESYDEHGHAMLFFPEIHPHHLEAVDYRNQE
jgi:hypothetical protein